MSHRKVVNEGPEDIKLRVDSDTSSSTSDDSSDDRAIADTLSSPRATASTPLKLETAAPPPVQSSVYDLSLKNGEPVKKGEHNAPHLPLLSLFWLFLKVQFSAQV